MHCISQLVKLYRNAYFTTMSKNEVLEKDEENQVYSYLYQKGYRVDQVKGLIAEGLFADYDDIRTSPKQEFGTVQPGDIKYKDVNCRDT